ncbi:WD40/YVTN/BNR-like repeat-containing protein [Pseudomonas sp. MMS21 TM103]|uniref:WD40/YVTN/BNR-like repeat-containing protein n=1 Tax=Pseudomonas sp. MMS21 TM103 TaxID=2886506 RepID=UPI001EE061FD|nr:YCF48-related protein [Pseudomonas sp. MMS21 TM103]
MNSRLGSLALAFYLSAFASLTYAEGHAVGSVLSSPAMQIATPAHAVLIDLARAGDRLVAVGERGVIVLSDDNGQTWRQVQVPVSVSLVSVQFVDTQRGWAVGHAGVVLATVDGGEHWHLQLTGVQAAEIELKAAQDDKAIAADTEAADMRISNAERLVADGADKPFLALHFLDAKHGLVVGSYGIAFSTQDGGGTWYSQIGHIENPSLVHLYAIAQKDHLWFLAGEQGYVARSTDDGESFAQLQSPYNGSFFTANLRGDGALLVAGLKGHAYLSSDDGDSFHSMKVFWPTSISSSIRMPDGTVLLANQAGGLLSSSVPNGEELNPVGKPLGIPVSSIIEAVDGSLITSGVTGLSRFSHLTTDVPE